MAENLIQIKRSATTAVPTDLEPGELAYSGNGQILYIGSVVGASNTANVVAIGSLRTPGVLTANLALVANSSSWIDNVQSAKLIVGPAGTTVNVTSISTDGSIGTTNNNNQTLLTAAAVKSYVDNYSANAFDELTDVTITTPSNNDVVMYQATGSQWVNKTVIGTSNEVEVTFPGTGIQIGLPDSVVVTTQLSVSANVVLGTNRISVGNSTVNTFITPSAIETDGTLTVLGAGSFANTLSVTGGVGLSNTLSVTGAVGLSNTLTVNGLTTLQNDVDVTGVADFSSTINVTGAATFSNTIQVTGAATFGNNVTINGDLDVNGTLTTIDSVNLTITDPMIKVARQNDAASGDTVDTGFYGVSNTAGSVQFHGLFRDASDSGKFKLYKGLGVEPTTTVATGDLSFTRATLVADVEGNITSSSVAITGGTITGITDLAVADGGTGVSAFTQNGVFFGNTSSQLGFATGTAWQVLQLNGSGVPTFASLDGGTF